MTPWQIAKLYKEETGTRPFYEEEVEIEIYRSKGQWIIPDIEFNQIITWRNQGCLRFVKSDEDYIEWLEQKVLTLINQ